MSKYILAFVSFVTLGLMLLDSVLKPGHPSFPSYIVAFLALGLFLRSFYLILKDFDEKV